MSEAATKTTASREDSRAHERRDDPEIVIVREAAGIDLPVVGHVPYRTAGFYGALAVAGTVGLLEWPVAAVVGVAYTLARR